MKWIKIEKKWHEMARRLQTASPRGTPEMPRLPSDEKRPAAPTTKGVSVALPVVEGRSTTGATLRASA